VKSNIYGVYRRYSTLNLFAPDKGSVTGKKIATPAGDLSDSIKSQCKDLPDKFNEFIKVSKESFAGIVTDIKERLIEEDAP
jgi:hypothetical protein